MISGCSFVLAVLVWMDEYRSIDVSATNVGLHTQFCMCAYVSCYFVEK